MQKYKKHCKSIYKENDNPRCGGIIFNKDYSKVLLVKNRSCGKWGFPKGGSNKNETKYNCAIREVQEETGIKLNVDCTIFSSIKLDKYYYLLAHIDESKLKTLRTNDPNEISCVNFMDIKNIPDLYTNANLKNFHLHYGNSIDKLIGSVK